MRNLTFRFQIALAALAFAAVPALTGCGGGNSDSTPTQAVSPSPPGSPASGGRANGSGEKPAPDAKRRSASKPDSPSGENGAKKKAKKNSPGNSHQASTLIDEAKKLIAGSGKGQKTVSSKRKIRKIIKELKEGSREQGKPAKSPYEVVEEILGR